VNSSFRAAGSLNFFRTLKSSCAPLGVQAQPRPRRRVGCPANRIVLRLARRRRVHSFGQNRVHTRRRHAHADNAPPPGSQMFNLRTRRPPRRPDHLETRAPVRSGRHDPNDVPWHLELQLETLRPPANSRVCGCQGDAHGDANDNARCLHKRVPSSVSGQ
jgi:hypothetical protein